MANLLFISLLLINTVVILLFQNPTILAEKHIKIACETVWENASIYKINMCTKRGMAAMAEENRLRDNELKRLLLKSERDLEICMEELNGIKK